MNSIQNTVERRSGDQVIRVWVSGDQETVASTIYDLRLTIASCLCVLVAKNPSKMHKNLHKFTKAYKNLQKLVKSRAKIRISYLVSGISSASFEKTNPIARLWPETRNQKTELKKQSQILNKTRLTEYNYVKQSQFKEGNNYVIPELETTYEYNAGRASRKQSQSKPISSEDSVWP